MPAWEMVEIQPMGRGMTQAYFSPLESEGLRVLEVWVVGRFTLNGSWGSP